LYRKKPQIAYNYDPIMGDAPMPSVADVAQYLLETHGPMTTMKLQKLVYYSQAWAVVWDDDCIFPEKIQAWKNGPVVPELWHATRGQFRIDRVNGGNSGNLTNANKETIGRVLAFYGDKDAQWLSDLTHMEDPWKYAYAQGANTEISLENLSEYYSSLSANVET
jgi:uncharacterized phage-associated protein